MRTENRMKNLAALSVALLAGFFIFTLMNHILNPGINAFRYSLSIYMVNPYGILTSAGLLMVGISEVITSVVISRLLNRCRWVSAIVFIMALTAFTIALVPMDISQEMTISGAIHIWTAGIQFAFFPIVAVLFGTITNILFLKRFSYLMAFSALLLFPFITISNLIESPDIFNIYGLLQKIYVLLVISWLAMINIHYIRNHQN